MGEMRGFFASLRMATVAEATVAEATVAEENTSHGDLPQVKRRLTGLFQHQWKREFALLYHRFRDDEVLDLLVAGNVVHQVEH